MLKYILINNPWFIIMFNKNVEKRNVHLINKNWS
jgi:hypothetical protein